MATSKLRGGDKLEAALAELRAKLDKDATLQVGFFSSATYPDGTYVALVAAIQNFGAPARGIPPRPFFSNAIAKHKGDWPRGIAHQLKATKYDVKLTLELTGEAIKGQIRQSIQDTNSPPLKQATIDAKGFDKPLIDTGRMFNSVTYTVKVNR